MTISYTEELLEPGLRLVRLTGVLDTAGAMVIEDDFHRVLLDGDCSVIVDLSSVPFISSYGMRMLLIAAKRLMDSGCVMHLAAPTPPVMSVITIAGFHELFPVHDSIEDARLFLSSGPVAQ